MYSGNYKNMQVIDWLYCFHKLGRICLAPKYYNPHNGDPQKVPLTPGLPRFVPQLLVAKLPADYPSEKSSNCWFSLGLGFRCLARQERISER